MPKGKARINTVSATPSDLAMLELGARYSAVPSVSHPASAATRQSTFVFRAVGGTPVAGSRVDAALIANEKVHLLLGSCARSVMPILTTLANQRNLLFLASAPLTDQL